MGRYLRDVRAIANVEGHVLEIDILSDCTETLVRLGAEEAAVVEAVRELRHRWGGSEVYVQAVDREQRDRIAHEALQRGATIDEAAKAAGCSTSTIRRRSSRWL